MKNKNFEEKVRQEKKFIVRFLYIFILFFIYFGRIFKYISLILFAHPGASFTKAYPLTKKGYKISYVKHYSFVQQLRIGFVSSLAVAIIMTVIAGISMPSSKPIIASALTCPVVDGGAGDSDGSVNGTVVINANTAWTNSGAVGDYFDCTAITLVRITNNAILTFNTDTATGKFVYAKFNQLTIDSGSSISSNAKGCAAVWGNYSGVLSASNTCSTGGGLGGATSCNNSNCGGAGGGSHGGAGGNGTTYASLVTIYDLIASPHLFGASGGTAFGTGGGTGGGVIRLTINNTLTLNGSITANGNNGAVDVGATQSSGGGAGGSIFITAGTVGGTTGSILAKGGNGGACRNTACGGGGGGGVVTINYTTDNSSFLSTLTNANAATGGTAGGGSAVAGSNGIFTKNTSLNTTLTDAKANDIDSDGKVDQIKLVFDRVITASSINTSDFSLSGGYTISAASRTDYNIVDLTVNEKPDTDLNTSIDVSIIDTISSEYGTDLTSASKTAYKASCSVPNFTPFSGNAYNGWVNIRSNTTWAANSLAYDCTGLGLNVDNNSTLTLNTNIATGIYVNATYSNITVTNGSTITSTGKGCSAMGTGPNSVTNICTAGNGSPGAVDAESDTTGYGGGGYAGNGGYSYDSVTSPYKLGGTSPYGNNNLSQLYFGSAGGSSSYRGTAAGIGGGIISLTAVNNFTLNGALTAKGTNSSIDVANVVVTGPGSGGSIYLSTNVFSGTTGTINAGGGNGLTQGPYYAGGGGGGRVYIRYRSNTSSFLDGLTAATVSAGGTSGGSLAQNGGNGSLVTYADVFPDTPSITSPNNGAVDQSRNLTITTSAYSGYDSHLNSDWQIATDVGFVDIVWQADNSSSLTSIIVNSTNGAFQGSLTGYTKLKSATYYLRARHTNNYGDSFWTVVKSFTTTNTAPTVSNIIAVQKNDGIGSVDLSFDASDANSDVQINAKIELNTGSDWIDPIIDETDALTSASQGDPKAENDNVYQIGNASGYITTAGGTNTIQTDLAAVNFLGITSSTVQVRITLNDLTADGATVTSDNFSVASQGQAQTWHQTAPTSDYSFDAASIEVGVGTGNTFSRLIGASIAGVNSNTKYKELTITNNVDSVLTNQQVQVVVPFDSDMQADFDDIRFTAIDGSTLLDYWLETKTDSTTATFWVEVPSIPISGIIILMQYGNAAAVSASNAENTFERVIANAVTGLSLDEGSGTTCLDKSSAGHNATFTGAPTWLTSANCRQGTCLNFDGSDDALSLGSWFNYNTFSLSFWVKPGTTQNAYADIIDNNHSGSTNWVVQQNNTTLNQYSNAIPPGGTGNFNLTASVWQHIVVVKEPSSAKVYVNNSLVASAGALAITYSSPNLYFARHATLGRYWKGALDEVTFYNGALTTDEVSALYSNIGIANGTSVMIRKYVSTDPTVTAATERILGTSYNYPITAPLTDWLYRKPITINNTNGSELTNFQVKVIVPYDSDMQADFDDIRFTAADGTTLLDYWLETKTNSDNATYWVEIPNLAASAISTIYVYYGNSGASSLSNSTNTFVKDISNALLLYSVNEGSGTTLTNLLGTGSNGTINGATWSTSGKFRNALSFDGSNDLVSIPDSPNWAFTDFTIALWVKFTAAPSGDWWTKAFIAQDVGGGSNHKWIFTYDPGTQKTTWHVNNVGVGSMELRSNAWAPTVGQWYHVGITKSGNNYTFYKDGIANGTASSVVAIPNAAAAMTMGWGEGAGSFYGSEDDLGIYNRALSAAEISALATNQIYGSNSNSSNAYLRQYATIDPRVTIIGNENWFGNIGISNAIPHPAYTELIGLTETLGDNNQGTTCYQLSNNNTDWYYFSSTWTAATTPTQCNPISTANTNIGDFVGQVGTGDFYYRAYYNSSTTQQVEVDKVKLYYIGTANTPDTPSITSPAEAATGLARNPTATTSAFSGYGVLVSTDWQVCLDAECASSIWESLSNTVDKTLITVNSSTGSYINTYSGFTQLGPGQYYIRARYANSVGTSAWSDTVGFSTLNTVPALSNLSAAQRTDGSGIVDVAFDANDVNNDQQLRVKIELNIGAGFVDPNLDETDGNTTAAQGDPKVENDNPYQIGNSSGWITTAGGANTVNFDLAASNFAGIDSSTVQFRLTANDQVEDSSVVTSNNFTVDRVNPTTPGSFLNTAVTLTSAAFTWSASTETNFNHYEIWYGANQSDVNNRNGTALEWDNDPNDAALASRTTTTTTLTGLNQSTDYYAKICAQDNYGNEFCADFITFQTNTLPSASDVSATQSSDGDGNVAISFTADDAEDQTLQAKVEYSINGGDTWQDPTLAAAANINNDSEYQRSSIITAAGPQTVNVTWQAATDVLNTTDINTAKIKITPYDTQAGAAVAGSSFVLDVVAPTIPSSFAANNITSGQIGLTWVSSTETNFNHYEIWYGTNQTDVNNRNNTASEWDNDQDAALASKTTILTTINNLFSITTYYFKICAADNYGNENCSDNISQATGTPPVVSQIQAAQKTDASNIVDLSFVIDDIDDSDNIMAKVEVDTGSGFQKAVLATADASTTAEYGDPKVNNDNDYQIGTASGYILSSYGENRVHADLSASNFTSINSSEVKVRITANDQGNDSATVTPDNFIIDTANPTAPSVFVKTVGLGNNAPLSWVQSIETNFNHYEIWYGTNQTDVDNRNNTAIEFDNIPDDLNLADITTHTTIIPDLTNNGTYYAKICAIDNYGHEACTSSISFITNMPPDISDITATPVNDGSGKIEVDFTIVDTDTNGGSLAAVLEYNLNDDTGWHKATIVGGEYSSTYGTPAINNSNDYPIGGLAGNAGSNTITIRWDTHTDVGTQDISNVSLRVRTSDSVETNTVPSPLPIVVDNVAPANLSSFSASTYNSSSIRWNWNTVTENHFFRYEIWYGTNENDVNNRTGTAIRWDEGDDNHLNTRTTINTNITGLTDNTIYYAKIFAKDTFLNETTLPAVSFKTNAFTNIVSLNQSHSRRGDGLLTVNFDIGDYDTTDNLRAAFQYNIGSGWHNGTVYLRSGSGVNIDNNATEQLLNITVPSGSKTISIIWDSSLDVPDAELNNAQLRLVPYDQIEVGSQSFVVDVLVDNIPPRGLTNLHKESGTNNSITLNWAPVSAEPYFNNYEIWYGTNESDVTNRAGTAVKWDNSNDTNLANLETDITTISGLNSNTDIALTYYFKAIALDQAGNEIQTNTIQADLGEEPPISEEHSPVFSGELPNVSFIAGQTTITVFDLDDYFSHPDNLSLVYSVSGQHYLTVSIDQGTVTFSAPETMNGSESLVFYAIDSNNRSANSNTIIITVSEPEETLELEPNPEETETVDHVLGTQNGRGIISVIGNKGTILNQWQAFGVGGVIPRLSTVNSQYYIFALKYHSGTTLHIYDINGEILINRKISCRLHWRRYSVGELDGKSKTKEIALTSRLSKSLYLKVYQFHSKKNHLTLEKRYPNFIHSIKNNYTLTIQKRKIILKNKNNQILKSWKAF